MFFLQEYRYRQYFLKVYRYNFSNFYIRYRYFCMISEICVCFVSESNKVDQALLMTINSMISWKMTVWWPSRFYKVTCLFCDVISNSPTREEINQLKPIMLATRVIYTAKQAFN